MIRFLLKLLGVKLEPQRSKQGAEAMVEADAAMSMVVRRFQGRYTCGCKVDPDVFQPPFCVNHPGAEMVFAEKDMGTQFAKRVRVPKATFRGGL